MCFFDDYLPHNNYDITIYKYIYINKLLRANKFRNNKKIYISKYLADY